MIFSSGFCEAIKSRIRGFDAMVEASIRSSHDRLSDVLIKDRSRGDWLDIMIHGIDVLSIKLRKRNKIPPSRLFPQSFDTDDCEEECNDPKKKKERGRRQTSTWPHK